MQTFMTWRGTSGSCRFYAESIATAIEMVIRFDFPRWGLYIQRPKGEINSIENEEAWWLSINSAYWRTNLRR